MSRSFVRLSVACALLFAATSSGTAADDPDELYRQRENLASASRAAALWAERGTNDYEAAWKLSRITYWLGKHLPESERRAALNRGIESGENAIRLEPGRPEGHFWLAASMGALAESYGIAQGVKYRGRIKQELQRVIEIDTAWQGGSAHAALGRWYHKVPGLFGGSESKAEAELRQALTFDPNNLAAATFLADVLLERGRNADAITWLQRIAAAPVSTEWGPEDREYKKEAADRLTRVR